MTKPKKDPILSSANILMRIMQIFCVIGIFLFVAAAIAALIFQGEITAELKDSYPDVSGSMPYLISAFIISIVPLIALFWLQLNRLKAVVNTVHAGNPFARVNGERLRFIAILIFMQQLLVFMTMPLIAAIQVAAGKYAGSGGDEFRTIDFEISLTALLVALLLIILGRVFEQGADMQDELEGTV